MRKDAFQATFFVLARKAGRVRWEADVAPWLHAVALRSALKARTASVRRQARERHLAQMHPPEANEAQAPCEFKPALDEEVQRLPWKYRAPVLLHYFEGKTYAEAATALGWPTGTVAVRLARARTLLRKRLERRGVTLATTLAAATVADHAPAALAQTTIWSATLFAAGGTAAAGALPAPALVLTKGVLRAMFIARLKIVAVVVLTLGTLAAGAGLAGWRPRPVSPADPAPQARAEADRADEPSAGDLKERVVGLQRENERLNRELHELRDKVARMEQKIEPAGEGGEAVVYEGKPTAYWMRQLKDRSPKYRAAAVEALGAIAPVDQRVIPTLVKALDDPGYAVSSNAVAALVALGENGRRIILDALHGGSPATRLHVANALNSEVLPLRVQIPALIHALADKDAAVREAAAHALGQLRPIIPALEVPTLTRALDDPAVSVRLWAVVALQRFPYAEGTPALLEACKNDTAEVRRAAVSALCSPPMVTPPVYSALVLATQDTSPEVRETAHHAVLRTSVRASGSEASPIPAKRALIGLLKHDKHPAVRIAAARLVGSLPLTSEVALALHEAGQDDPDPQVRKAAEDAYKQLTSQPSADEGADPAARRTPTRGGFGGRARRGDRPAGGLN